jgi:hypothetical protein
VEARIPARKTFSTLETATSDIYRYIKFSNVSISPWFFTELENKYDIHGNVAYIGVNYESAIIDKLFFDFDLEKCIKDDKGNRINTPFPQAREYAIRVWDWAKQYHYRRECAFSGGGYQIFIKCSIPTMAYSNTIKSVIQNLNLEYDDVISLAQLRRYVGSFNFGNDKKNPRNLYCIGLTDEEVYLPVDDLKKLATTWRKDRTLYDIETYIPKDIKINTPRLKFKRDPNYKPAQSLDEIFTKYGMVYNDICPCIRSIIEQPSVSHQQRIVVIKYLKTIHYIKYEDMIQLLPLILTSPHGLGNDGSHSVSEKQPDHIYSSKYSFNPSWMVDNGFCPRSCSYCDELIKEMKRIG